MATLHGQMVYYVGDTLMMDVSIKDAAGAVLNLTGCDLEWKLNDPYGVNVETYSIRDGITTGGIDIIDPSQGTVAITVGSTSTQDYVPGYYSDQLRVWVPDPGFADILATQLVGSVRFKQPLQSAAIALQAASLATSPPGSL